MNYLFDALKNAGIPVVWTDSTGENESQWTQAVLLSADGYVPQANATANVSLEITADMIFDVAERLLDSIGLKPVRTETVDEYGFHRVKLRLKTRHQSATLVLLREGDFFSVGTIVDDAH